MKFFIDTANLQQIKEFNDLGLCDGVTTNPSLMAKEGISGKTNIIEHYANIASMVDGHVSAEVIATDYEGMIKEGKELAAIAENIVVKVPMTVNGIKAIRTFHDDGILTNCTLVFSVTQAILAAKAGATYVSPFMGRLDDIAYSGIELINGIVEVYSNYMFETEVLAASVRHPLHVSQCASASADVVTAPYNVYMQLFNNPLTDIGLAKFLEDHAKLNK